MLILTVDLQLGAMYTPLFTDARFRISPNIHFQSRIFFGAQLQSDKSENRQQMNAEEDPAPLAMNAILASAGAGGRRRVSDGRCAGLERA